MFSDPLSIQDGNAVAVTIPRTAILPNSGRFNYVTGDGIPVQIDVVQRSTKTRRRAEFRITMTKPISGSSTGAVDSTTAIIALDRPKAASFVTADLVWLLKYVAKVPVTAGFPEKLINGES